MNDSAKFALVLGGVGVVALVICGFVRQRNENEKLRRRLRLYNRAKLAGGCLTTIAAIATIAEMFFL